MFVFFRDKSHILFAILFLISISPFLVGSFQEKVDYSGRKEIFDQKLQAINSLDKVLHYTDSLYSINHAGNFDTLKYVQIVSDFIKQKFYHGLSNYTFSQNWIAYLSGKLVWSHFAAIVKPDDILKYPEGLCSQQNIIFSEILRKKGITSRAVGLGPKEGPGHYLTEVFYNNGWHIYDVDLEPNWEVTQQDHPSLNYLLNNKETLYKIYENKLKQDHIDLFIKNVNYGKPNVVPAKNMLLFHQITLILTYLLPFIFLFMFTSTLIKLNKVKNKNRSDLRKEVLVNL